LDEGDNTHLRLAPGALKRIHLVDSLNARGPSTPTELPPIVAFLFFRWRMGELGAFTSAPTGIPSIVSGQRLIGLRDMTRKLSEKLQSVKFVSGTILGGIGNDVILD
jgi:hypothetical protein